MPNRLLRIFLGWVAMVTVPFAIFFVLNLLLMIFFPSFNRVGNEPVMPWFVAGSAVLFMYAAISTAPGILLMVLISEKRKIDSRLWYAGAGGLICLSAFLISAGAPSIKNLVFALIPLAAGMFGGLLYWAIAWNYEE
jgi:hypothetical protein